ncbi:hypothetical protein [Burkholderia sp. Ax-1724]|uniref:hypothetical protein n=1 Tax=Burkholderia sp. Ax-1724 TaxID=2608336 RepID=UPI00141FB48C|nr:hypothetical protein [Burkholderia sp. Ax-1724]
MLAAARDLKDSDLSLACLRRNLLQDRTARNLNLEVFDLWIEGVEKLLGALFYDCLVNVVAARKLTYRIHIAPVAHEQDFVFLADLFGRHARADVTVELFHFLERVAREVCSVCVDNLLVSGNGAPGSDNHDRSFLVWLRRNLDRLMPSIRAYAVVGSNILSFIAWRISTSNISGAGFPWMNPMIVGF